MMKINFGRKCPVPNAIFIIVFAYFFNTHFYINAQNTDSLQLEKSIENAIGYLNHRIDSNQLYNLAVPLLIPLKEYYKLPLSNQIGFSPDRLNQEIEKKMYDLYSVYYQFKNRKRHYKLLHNKWDGIDGLNLFSLYCDKALAKTIFFASVDSSLALKGYELTHAYLATLVIKRTKCICKKQNIKLSKLIWPNLKKMIPDNNQMEYSDLNIETIALVLYGGETESISQKHISKLLSLQKTNGSWSGSNNTSKLLSDHSTVLALWALLEWKFQEDLFLYLPMN